MKVEHVIVGAWEGDVRPDGGLVCAFPDGRVRLLGQTLQSHEWIRNPVIHPTLARCAGYTQQSNRIVEWMGDHWEDRGPGCGVRACLYLPDGTLAINPDCSAPYYGQGLRYFDGTRIVPAHETYADPARGLYEYITRGDVTVGQGGVGPHGQDPCIVLVDGTRRLLAAGRVRIVRFARSGDQIAIGYHDMTRPAFVVVFLSRADLVDLEDITPAPEPAPQPEPAPVSGGFAALRAAPRKLWVSAYKSFGVPNDDRSSGFEDGRDPIGNVLMPENGHVARAGETALRDRDGAVMPLIVSHDADDALAKLDWTIAWYVHGAGLADLREKVRWTLATLPERPVIAYLDDERWPDDRPDWVTDRVWPNVQAYRGLNPDVTAETLDQFEARVGAEIARVHGYGRPFGLTVQCYDRNGLTSEDHALSTLPAVERWMRHHPIVAVLLFADVRRGGMRDHARLRAWAHALYASVPERPSKYDYWSADNRIASWRNRLMQNVDMLAVTAEERRELLEALVR